MVDKTKTFVYNNKEYYLTGRVARNKNKSPLLEITPKHKFGFEEEFNLWVLANELYEVEKIDEDEG